MLHRRTLIAATLAASLGWINTCVAGDITIENAWVRSAPPMSTVMAGYMTIHNHSSKAVTLTSITSPVFESIELHSTTMHDGMMHMEGLKSLAIEGNGTVKLEPNGYHLMLNNPKQKINTGDTIHFTLNFDDQTEEVTATVKQDEEQESAPMMMHHHQM